MNVIQKINITVALMLGQGQNNKYNPTYGCTKANLQNKNIPEHIVKPPYFHQKQEKEKGCEKGGEDKQL